MIDISITEPLWASLDIEGLCQDVARTCLLHMGLPEQDCEISLLACDDAQIAQLNGDFRDKPRPTNVLSWPAEDLAPEAPGGTPFAPEADPDGTITLGDIAITYGVCRAEAEAAQKPMKDHVTHLLVHGILHLLGYDHISDADAARMEALEIEILAVLGVEDPYNDD